MQHGERKRKDKGLESIYFQWVFSSEKRIIFSDLKIPGFTLCQICRNLSHHNFMTVTILILTSNKQKLLPEEIHRLGGDHEVMREFECPISSFVIFLTINQLWTNHQGNSIVPPVPGSLIPSKYKGNIQTVGLQISSSDSKSFNPVWAMC